MGRNKTERKIGTHTEDQMQKALDATKAGKSIRQAATEHGLAFSTLQRYVKKKAKDNPEHLTPNYSVRKIFTDKHEVALRNYYKNCGTRDFREIAYHWAKMNKIPIPKSWEANQMAGIDWLRGFRERFPDMTLRKPESCSLAPADSETKKIVEIEIKKENTEVDVNTDLILAEEFVADDVTTNEITDPIKTEVLQEFELTRCLENPQNETNSNGILLRDYETDDAEQLNKTEKSNTENPNLSFFYSLLPDMNEMSSDQKRRFKIGVLQLASDILQET